MYRISHFCSNCRNAFSEEISELKVGIVFACPHCAALYSIADTNGTILRRPTDKQSYRYVSIPGFGFQNPDTLSGWQPV